MKQTTFVTSDKRFILSYNELEKMGFTIQYEDDF